MPGLQSDTEKLQQLCPETACLTMQLTVSHCFLDMNHGHKNDSVAYFVKLIFSSATQINILCIICLPWSQSVPYVCSLLLLPVSSLSLQSLPIDCQLPKPAVSFYCLSAP